MSDLPSLNLHDLYHVARKGHFEAKQKGQENHTSLAIMGGCMVVMGASMLLKAWKHSQGRSR